MGALSLSGILGSFSWPWITPLLPSHAAAWAPTEGCGDGGPEEGPPPSEPFCGLPFTSAAGWSPGTGGSASHPALKRVCSHSHMSTQAL